jgi:hypothetical protein
VTVGLGFGLVSAARYDDGWCRPCVSAVTPAGHGYRARSGCPASHRLTPKRPRGELMAPAHAVNQLQADAAYS